MTVDFLWFAVILSIASAVLALYSGIVRDPDGYFSLGRSQMLFWTVLVVLSFLYLWLTKNGAIPDLPNGVLALMGISGSTGLAAGLIDDDKRTTAAAAGASTAAPPVPHGFFGRLRRYLHDISCSDQTIDLHRLQIIVWTLVFGGVFLRTVRATGAMPQFTASQMLLLGISSGAYIGFKFREPA